MGHGVVEVHAQALVSFYLLAFRHDVVGLVAVALGNSLTGAALSIDLDPKSLIGESGRDRHLGNAQRSFSVICVAKAVVLPPSPYLDHSDVSEEGFERSRNPVEIECFGEERPIGDFAARVGPEESPELGLDGPFALRRLVLEDPEGSDLALGLNNFDDGTSTE